MTALIDDLRYALRRLCKSYGFAASAVCVLALGIGISVTMFGVLRGVLFGSLPFPDSARVMSVAAGNPAQQVQYGALTAAEVQALTRAGEEGRSPFAQFGQFNWGGVTLFDDARPRERAAAIVGAGFFPALGVKPLHGRWFNDVEFVDRLDVVVLAHDEFLRLLGGRPDAIGEFIDTADGPLRVIGVMPPEFATPSSDVGAWLPYLKGRLDPGRPGYANSRQFYAVARLAAGVDVTQANDRLTAVMSGVRETNGLPDEGWRLTATSMLDAIVGDVRGTLWSVFAIAVLVLMIACTNVAILVDARQVARRHEQALTLAIGASRMRIWRTLLMELAVLAVLGVVIGVLVASFGLDTLRTLAQWSLPRTDAIAIDPSVLAFAVALGVAAPFLVVVAGALSLRGSAADALRSGGKGLVGAGARTRRLLPAAAIALSTVSLIAAVALVLSLMRLSDVEPGFRTERIHAIQLFRNTPADQVPAFAEQVRERLAAVPGVEAAAVTSAAPLSRIGHLTSELWRAGETKPEPYLAGVRRVGADYLSLLDIGLLAGRGIDERDHAGGEPVAVISRELARRTFGEASPVGQTIDVTLARSERVGHRIVGVMDDIHNDGLRAPPAPEVLIPFAQSPGAGVTFLVRAQRDDPTLPGQLLEQLWAVDPRQATTREFMLTGEVDDELHTVRFFASTVGAFALLAVLMGGFGIYAVAALQQRRRLREFGLRLAVGAQPRALATQVLIESLRMAGLGVAVGLVGAWAALRLMHMQLFGFDDGLAPVLIAGVAGIALTTVIAALLPARRAARVDPMIALRYE